MYVSFREFISPGGDMPKGRNSCCRNCGHAREGGHPVAAFWIPAFAGMTAGETVKREFLGSLPKAGEESPVRPRDSSRPVGALGMPVRTRARAK